MLPCKRFIPRTAKQTLWLLPWFASEQIVVAIGLQRIGINLALRMSVPRIFQFVFGQALARDGDGRLRIHGVAWHGMLRVD